MLRRALGPTFERPDQVLCSTGFQQYQQACNHLYSAYRDGLRLQSIFCAAHLYCEAALTKNGRRVETSVGFSEIVPLKVTRVSYSFYYFSWIVVTTADRVSSKASVRNCASEQYALFI